MDRQRLFIYVALGLAVLVVYVLFEVVWVALLSAAVAAVVAIAVYRRMQRRDRADSEVAPAAPDDAAWIGHLEQLLALNLKVREQALAEPVTAKLEEIIDELRGLVPELSEDHAGSELTWIVNRMASDYLPRIVNPFVGLSPAGRAENQDELLSSLEGLENELANIRELVRNHKVGEFKAKAAFLRTRFLESPG